MTIPQGYKQTELGVIPENWEIATIGRISQNRSYGVGAEAVSYSGGPKYIRITDIDDQTRQYLPSPLSSPAFYNENHIVKKNDILFARTGASVGKSYVYDIKDGMLIFAGFLMRFNIHNASAKFVFYNTLSKRYNDWVMSESARTGQPGLNIKQLSSYTIPLPPLPEQKAIAEALSDVDDLITALDKKIAKKRLVKQGAMQELLTGKKRLPGFEEEWEEVELGEILSYEQPTKYLVSSTEYCQSGTPVLTAGKTFVLGYTTETTGIYTDVPVIIFDDFTTDCKYVTTPFKAKSSAMKMLQLKDKRYNLRLIYDLMQLINFPLYDHQRYWISEYSKIKVNIPSSFDEQQAIAIILSDMDKEIAELEAQRDKYRLVKSGMMQKLLTGEIRLRKE